MLARHVSLSRRPVAVFIVAGRARTNAAHFSSRLAKMTRRYGRQRPRADGLPLLVGVRAAGEESPPILNSADKEAARPGGTARCSSLIGDN